MSTPNSLGRFPPYPGKALPFALSCPCAHLCPILTWGSSSYSSELQAGRAPDSARMPRFKLDFVVDDTESLLYPVASPCLLPQALAPWLAEYRGGRKGHHRESGIVSAQALERMKVCAPGKGPRQGSLRAGFRVLHFGLKVTSVYLVNISCQPGFLQPTWCPGSRVQALFHQVEHLVDHC